MILTKNGSKNRLQFLFYFMALLPILGTGMVIVVAMNFIPFPHIEGHSNPYSYWVTIGYGILIGGASYIAGGFGGFLFALPRYISNPDSIKISYSRNNNLIEISDWLTKIIVGLGLTNLYKIPGAIDAFGVHAEVLFGSKPLGAAIAESILIYFLISGFLLGYLWTNIYYIPILADMDILTNNILKEMQALETAANAAVDKYTESINSTDPGAFIKVENMQKESQGRNKILSFNEFSTLIDKAKQKMQNGIKAQSNLSDDLKDPNKNQYGGKTEVNDRKIAATTITPVDDSDLYRIVLTVSSTKEANPLPEGDVVLFSLHNSWEDPYKLVTVKNGVASLEIISYGAFTVGVLCDDGNTELEYDLVNAPMAPKKFRER